MGIKKHQIKLRIKNYSFVDASILLEGTLHWTAASVKSWKPLEKGTSSNIFTLQFRLWMISPLNGLFHFLRVLILYAMSQQLSL